MNISKIIFEINGREIAVSVADARKLYDALGELFARPVTMNTPCFRRHHDDFYNPFASTPKFTTTEHKGTETFPTIKIS
jgi:hypothetical protein